jgi:hypothetical protein
MRHFFAYHNEKGMGYSSTTLSDPHVKTKNPVSGLKGVTVWLVAGEGSSPKGYFLAARFVAEKCETNKFPGTDHPNLISGRGDLFKLSKPMNGSKLLQDLKRVSMNFQKGFHEIQDTSIISALQALV